MRHILLVFLMMFSFTAAGCKAEERVVADTPALESQEEFCGVSGRTLFGFKDPDHTQFSIPNAYLFDPYGAYHKVKDPADFISIRLWRDNLEPICLGDIQDISGLDRMKRIPEVKIDHQRISSMLPNRKHMNPVLVENGDDKLFDVYRTKKAHTTGDLRLNNDLLIPKDSLWSKNLFIECAYNLPSLKDVERVGCIVNSQLSENIIIQYVIHHTDLPQYQNIDSNIKKLVLTFKVSSGD